MTTHEQPTSLASIIFPPAPPASHSLRDSLLSRQSEFAAGALGLGRLLNLVPRQEVHGPPVRCALRCSNGAYLRLSTTSTAEGSLSWALTADSAQPSDPACCFIAHKGGVAMQLKVTFTHAESGLVLVVNSAGDLTATAAAAAAADDFARFRVESAPFVAGGVTIQSRAGHYLTADSTGYVSCRSPLAKLRQLFFLVEPSREQSRCDAYRQHCASASQVPPTPQAAVTQAEPIESSADAVARCDAQASAQRERAPTALDEALDEFDEAPDDWVPVSMPAGTAAV